MIDVIADSTNTLYLQNVFDGLQRSLSKKIVVQFRDDLIRSWIVSVKSETEVQPWRALLQMSR